MHLHDRFPQGVHFHLPQGVVEDEDLFDLAGQFLAEELFDFGVVTAPYRLFVGKRSVLDRPMVDGKAAGVDLEL
jgi:hypothetical protein